VTSDFPYTFLGVSCIHGMVKIALITGFSACGPHPS
jgi:hypothetical protein